MPSPADGRSDIKGSLLMVQKAAWVLATRAEWREAQRADWGALMGLKNRGFSTSWPSTSSWLGLHHAMAVTYLSSSFTRTRLGLLSLLLLPSNSLLEMDSITESQVYATVHSGPPPAPALCSSPNPRDGILIFGVSTLRKETPQVSLLCILAPWAYLKGRFSKPR